MNDILFDGRGYVWLAVNYEISMLKKQSSIGETNVAW